MMHQSQLPACAVDRFNVLLMSTPTRELENLSIGGDMNRRSRGQQRRRQREHSERQQRQQQPPQLQMLAPAPPTGPSTARATPQTGPSPTGSAASAGGRTEEIRSDSGMIYQIRNLSPHSRQTAAESLVNRDTFLIEQSRKHTDGERSYVAFQLGGGRDSVRIYPPGTRGRRIRCACEYFRLNANSAICGHIYVSFVTSLV